jgi:ribose transport system substrate-binding protein
MFDEIRRAIATGSGPGSARLDPRHDRFVTSGVGAARSLANRRRLVAWSPAMMPWLAACLAAWLTACRDRPREATPEAGPLHKPLRIAMIAKSSSNPSFLASRLGAENRARALGAKLGTPIEIVWMTPPQEDASVQAQRIAQAVTDRLDAVLISCSDAAKLTPAIDAAVAQGLPVMTFDSDAPASRRFSYAGVDDFKAGQAVMKELARVVPRRGKVAVLSGNPNAPNLRSRVEGVMSEAAHHPELTMLGPFFHVETPQEATAAVMRAETAHPDIVGWAMVGGWPLYTQTLLRDLEARRATALTVVPKIVSINALPPQLVYVDQGLAPVLLAQPTYLWGEVGVDAIVDKVLLGKTVPERIPMELVRVTVGTLGSWTRQLHAWGFPDAPEEYLQRP